MQINSHQIYYALEDRLLNLLSLSSFLAVKAEFEAEGTRIDELALLSELCCKNKIPLTLKIGGPSAQRDIYEAFQLGAKNILVPMVESKYSLLKCVELFNKFDPLFKNLTNMPKLFINIESKLALKNCDSIIETIIKEKLPVSSLVIGRTDLAASLGIKNIEDDSILFIVKDLIQKNSNLKFTLGGNLKLQSYDFVRTLSNYGLFGFESRKCTFKYCKEINNEKFKKIIRFGLEFELAWLNFKTNLYANRSEEETMRIKTITQRLKNS